MIQVKVTNIKDIDGKPFNSSRDCGLGTLQNFQDKENPGLYLDLNNLDPQNTCVSKVLWNKETWVEVKRVTWIGKGWWLLDLDIEVLTMAEYARKYIVWNFKTKKRANARDAFNQFLELEHLCCIRGTRIFGPFVDDHGTYFRAIRRYNDDLARLR